MSGAHKLTYPINGVKAATSDGTDSQTMMRFNQEQELREAK